MILPADPKAGYLAHKEELDRALRDVMESGWYILGQKVRSFEKSFAAYIGSGHCIGVANGTDAIQFALRACGVGPGDKVITVAHTAVATVSAIDWIGAIPVLVDVDPETFTLDPAKVEETLQGMADSPAKAIVAVHVYGHPAEMASLRRIADRYGAALIEDCAQAHGAMIGGNKAGTFGDCSAFSFYPTKNLGAFGDGGAIVTNDDTVAEKIRLIQQYGWRERYISAVPGYNSRLDELQAAVLECKLSWLDADNDRRRAIARRYTDGLAATPVETPVEREGSRHVYHQYTILLSDRDRLRTYLNEREISTGILYPVPVHLQPGYRDRVRLGKGGMDVTEGLAARLLCLPMYPELSDAQVDQTTEAIRSFFH